MTIQNDDIMEVAARMSFDGANDQIGSYQFRLATGGPITDEEGIDDLLAVMELIYTIVDQLMTLKLLFDDIRIFNQTQSVLLGIHDWPTLVAGTETQHPIPPGVAALINFSTEVPKVILRKFFGGFTEDQNQDDGTWNGTLVNAVADIGVLMLADFNMTNGTWEYGYNSPKILDWVRPNGASNNDIPAYQRRRKQGSGS